MTEGSDKSKPKKPKVIMVVITASLNMAVTKKYLAMRASFYTKHHS